MLFPAFFGCAQTVLLKDDFAAYVSRLQPYLCRADLPDLPEPPDPPGPAYPPPPAYEGLVNLYESVFDLAADFFGVYAYVERDGKPFLLDLGGNLLEISENNPIFHSTMSDITVENVVYDRAIVRDRNGFLGIADLAGGQLTGFLYRSVEIDKNAAIGRAAGYTDVYLNDVLLYRLETENVRLWSARFLNVDGAGVELESGLPLTVGGYPVFHPPSDGRILFYAPDSYLFGYADARTGEPVIPPRYLAGSDFYGGAACVYEPDPYGESGIGYPKILDKRGGVLFDFSSYRGRYLPDALRVHFLYEDYIVFEAEANGRPETGLLRFTRGGADALVLSEARVLEDDVRPYGGRVYGGYLVDRDIGRFYDVSSRSFAAGEYESILPYENLFLARRKAADYTLLDAGLKPVIERCASISHAYGILTVGNEIGYSYYIPRPPSFK